MMPSLVVLAVMLCVHILTYICPGGMKNLFPDGTFPKKKKTINTKVMKKFLLFLEPRGSLLRSQEPFCSLCPELEETSLHSPILSI
jgi:hypothetical protein